MHHETFSFMMSMSFESINQMSEISGEFTTMSTVFSKVSGYSKNALGLSNDLLLQTL